MSIVHIKDVETLVFFYLGPNGNGFGFLLICSSKRAFLCMGLQQELLHCKNNGPYLAPVSLKSKKKSTKGLLIARGPELYPY